MGTSRDVDSGPASRLGVGVGFILPLGVCLFSLVACPYTKVEESFNMQATHDILVHGTDIDAYDHHEFPGVVPRTFIGALVLSAIASPVASAVQVFHLSRFYMQYAVRASLAFLVCLALYRFARAFGTLYGGKAASLLCWICACQFHLMFYGSRTLPNTFAVALVMSACADWMRGHYHRCVFQLVAATVWFRCDMVLLLGTMGLTLLFTRKITLLEAIVVGLASVGVTLAVTVCVDSWFWRRWLWPEGEVFWFNTVLNQAHRWGTMPWHWYFTSALPRSLLGAALLLPVGLCTRVAPVLINVAGFGFDRRGLVLAAPALSFVVLYSFLPHKELRFIMPALIMLNGVAAHGLVKLFNMRRKTSLPAIAGFGLVLVSFLASRVFLAASEANYPGGVALHELHTSVYRTATELHTQPTIRVHIDAAAAMQGVTRFGELGGRWQYSKDESLTVASQFKGFDFCITADADKLGEYFDIAAVVPGFKRVNWREFKIDEEPRIYIMRRRSGNADADLVADMAKARRAHEKRQSRARSRGG